MVDDAIGVGDRVVILSMPGVFRVVARRGHLLTIETAPGVSMVVADGNVRRLDDAPPDGP